MTIWTNSQLNDEAMELLRGETGAHELLVSDSRTTNLGAGGEDPLLSQADIAFGQPDVNQTMAQTSLKWIQLTSAGYTRYDRPDLASAIKDRGAVLTNSSSVFDEPCAQHLLAFLMAHCRCLPQAFAAKTWNYSELRPISQVLRGQTILMLGYGAISKRLVELLAPFDLNLVAVRRTPSGDEGIKVRRIEDTDALLSQADFVASSMPGHASTDKFMDARRFGLMRPGSVFANVGRGTTVDQDALLAALQSGQLSAAYLDVTDPEPLPESHPLWSQPNCHITPHTAGGMQDEDVNMVRHFLANLRRYEAGEVLKDRVF